MCPPHRPVFVNRVVGVTPHTFLFHFKTPARNESSNDFPVVVIRFSVCPHHDLAGRQLRDGGVRSGRGRGRLTLNPFFLTQFQAFLLLGEAMRSFCKSFLRNSCSAVAILGIAAGTASAADVLPSFTGDSVIGDLARMNDLEPLAEIAAMQRHEQSAIPTYAKTSTAPADTHLRASVPAVNRSQSLFAGDVFANSAAVLPLLVGDMGPAVSPVSRPMSGRLVGARPSLPLTRLPLAKRSDE